MFEKAGGKQGCNLRSKSITDSSSASTISNSIDYNIGNKNHSNDNNNDVDDMNMMTMVIIILLI